MYPEKKEDIVLGSFFRKLDKTQWELKAAVPLFLHPKKTICLGNPQDLDLEVQFRENHFRCMNPNQTFRSFLFAKSKELYTEMPNSDIRILCTVHCGRNVSKPRTPHWIWRERTKALMWYYQILQSNKKQVKISRFSAFCSIWKIQ